MKPTPVPLVGLIKLANQTHLKKTYSLPAIFYFWRPTDFAEHRSQQHRWPM
jgi:hypothetical protein